MNKLISKSILLSMFLAFLVASPAMADTLELRGYGGWRDSNDGEGETTVYRDETWSQCRRRCLDSINCKGVEFALWDNGSSSCEVHTGQFDHVEEVESNSSVTTVWTRISN